MLALTNGQLSYEAAYSVVISNETGTLLSSNANFKLVTPAAIISRTPAETNHPLVFHKYLTMSVEVDAPGQFNGFPVSYQWQMNGTNITGATSNSLTVFGLVENAGTYSVLVSNVLGTDTTCWQLAFTYTGSYIAPGTLAYHLSTNAVGFAEGHTTNDMPQVCNWTSAHYTLNNLHYLTNAVWSSNCWLSGVKGLSATALGFSNWYGGMTLLTMVSPRHYLRAYHVGTPPGMICFLDTNNVIHWRTHVQQVRVGGDTDVGILNDDLPASVGYLPVLPADFSTYLPTNAQDIIQATGLDQYLRVFSLPVTLEDQVRWGTIQSASFGLSSDWNLPVVAGDSSNPDRLIIDKQLVLISQNHGSSSGPNLALQLDAINYWMHYLSTNNNLESDYLLTMFQLTNWPSIR